MRPHLDPAAEPAVMLDDVRKSYGPKTVLDSVSITVYRGEFFGVIGPNGAGKTTLIEIMEGLRRADAGKITVLGEKPWPRCRPLLPRIGVQTQEPAFFIRLTAAQHIETVASLYGKGTARAREQLALVGLTSSADTLVERLSVGQRQRLAIAAALVHEPELVFLDEPTAALDPQARRELWQVLRGITATGCTVVYTTHHMEEAEALCDRIALISAGKVVALDDPSSLIKGIDAPTQVVVPTVQLSEEQARNLEGADLAHVQDGSVVIETREVGRLLGAIGQIPGIIDVRTVTPSLEDVYLRLVGTEESQ